MASYNGTIKRTNFVTDDTLNVASATALDNFPLEDDTEFSWLANTNLFGDHTQVITPGIAQNYDGNIKRSHYHQWYDRIHVIPLSLDLGNVVAVSTQLVEVWNAYFVVIDIVSITINNLDGVVLTDDDTPTTYQALESRVYHFTVFLTGSPSINGSIDIATDIDLSKPRTYSIIVTGDRVLIFPFGHEATEKIKERYEFLTEIIESDNGTEQLIGKRLIARRSWSQSPIVTRSSSDNEVNARLVTFFKSLLTGWWTRIFAIPVWQDVAILTTLASAGDLSIAVDTVGRSYEPNSLVMLWKNEFINELAEIESVSDASITLKNPLNLTWAAGIVRVLPAKFARVDKTVSIEIVTASIQAPQIAWELEPTEKVVEQLIADTYDSYLGRRVLMRKNNAVATNEVYEHKIAIADSRSGVKYIDPLKLVPKSSNKFEIGVSDRINFGKVLEFLYSLNGQRGAFYAPTWMFDLQLQTSTILDADTSFLVSNVGYARFQFPNDNKHIMIRLKDGTLYFREITGATEADADTETIEIDTALGDSINKAEVDRISFLNLMRLASDSFSVAYYAPTGLAMFEFEIIETNE